MQEPTMNAVDMVRKIRDAHYEKLQGFSTQERIAFYRERARALYSSLGKPLPEALSETGPAKQRSLSS